MNKNQEMRDEEITIEELKGSLYLYIMKWKSQLAKTVDEKESARLHTLCYLAQWIINSKKGQAVDITKILRESE